MIGEKDCGGLLVIYFLWLFVQGRLDKRLYVPLPSAAERASILSAVARRAKLAADVDLTAVPFSTSRLPPPLPPSMSIEQSPSSFLSPPLDSWDVY